MSHLREIVPYFSTTKPLTMFNKTQLAIRYFPREEETIQTSVDSLRKAGYTGKLIVFADGHSPPLKDDNVDVRVLPWLGCFKNYDRALQTLIRESDKPYIAALGDDILYRNNFLNFAKEIIDFPKIGYLAMYTPVGVGRRHKWNKHEVGWKEIKGGWSASYGGGYLFNKEVAKRIVKANYYQKHLATYKANQQIDRAIPQTVHELKLRQFFHVPSLLKHIGVTSTIGHVHTKDEDDFGG